LAYPRYSSSCPSWLSFKKEIPIFLDWRRGVYRPSTNCIDFFCFYTTLQGLLSK
jgi:hypothetical protein